MPAAPGATPRKMLPPPITTPSSTPRRDTWAISATIASIVWRLMPKGSSPIKASPESLRRMRLYFGVNARSASVDGLDDAFADNEDGVVMHFAFRRRQCLLDGQLVVEHVGLAEQGDLCQVLVERAFNHLRRDFRRLARVLGACRLDLALAPDHIGGDIPFRQVLRPVEGEVHGEAFAELLGPLVIDKHADFARAVQILRELSFRLQPSKAPHRDVLADLLHQALALRFDPGPHEVERSELCGIFRVARGDDLCQPLGETEKVLVLGDEIRLAVELDERTDLAVGRLPDADDAFRGDAACGLARLGAALDAQQLLGLFQVAARFGQRLLALHHPEPGHLAQLFHQACTDLSHSNYAP